MAKAYRLRFGNNSGSRTFRDRKILHVLNKQFGVKPKNLQLYREAFRHSSSEEVDRINGLHSNERLEYLGDSLLGAFVAAYLFEKYETANEGELTRLRSKLVSRDTLNGLAIKLELNHVVKRNLPSGVETKTIFGNALEAVFGAIYLDRGTDYLFHILRKIFNDRLNIEKIKREEKDYKSRLYEWAQKEKKTLSFEVLEETTENNRKMYQVEARIDAEHKATGKGPSKKKAEQQASKTLISQIFKNTN